MNTPKMARTPISDVIVILPGILGSVLERQNRKLWAPSRLSLLSALVQLGRNFDSLHLNDAASGDTMSDGGVAASGLVSNVHLILWLRKIDGYTQLTNYICTRFDVVPKQNYFEFAYDWRLDNRIAADRLACLSRTWLQDWKQTSGASDTRLIVIAHSMGGLVARYFLEVLEGWRDTRMLITFGTPFRGSLNPLDYLVNGFRKLSGFVDLTHLIRSFPSVYQLLPI
jgi:hypothetical protein